MGLYDECVTFNHLANVKNELTRMIKTDLANTRDDMKNIIRCEVAKIVDEALHDPLLREASPKINKFVTDTVALVETLKKDIERLEKIRKELLSNTSSIVDTTLYY